MIKRVVLCNIIRKKNGVSTPVENFGDRLKTFLPSCVPNLQLENHTLNLDQQRAEFNAHCDFMVFQELILAHAMHQARLTNRRVSYHNKLKHILWLGALSALGCRQYLVLEQIDWGFSDFIYLLLVSLSE